jgi:hypothetical protein
MMGKFIATLMLAVCISGSAHAETGSSESPFSLRGFGTIGLARSSSDHAEFVRDLSQPVGIKGGQWSGRIDSILGLQANWQATREIELVGQVVSRLHYDRSHNPELMWAFAKWEPDPRFSLRGGRIGADFMMLADSRLVGYSYLTVRPPTDFFGPLFFSHFDGTDASVTVPLGEGLFRSKFFFGRTYEKSAGALGTWDTSGSPVRGIVLEYVTGPWQIRANAARIRFAENMNTSDLTIPLRTVGVFIPEANTAADSLDTKNTTSNFLSLGLVYDNGPVQIQGMLNNIHHDAAIYQNSHAGYLLTSYRFGTVTPYLGLSRWKTQPRSSLPLLPAPLDEAYQQYMTASKVDRVTYSIGVRYDFNTHFALKAQFDFVRAGKGKDFSYRNSDSESNGKTNVLSVALDFIF